MVLASLLFAAMGVCVKLASSMYDATEIVMYRSLVGVLMVGALARWQGVSLRTTVPGMHVARSVAGVGALSLWFFAFGGLPLATAMTLNYMSSVWMALFLLGGAVFMGARQLDMRLFAAVLAGFVGVALVLRPSMGPQQAWPGVAGLLSGMLAALAYLQVTALGRAGEPELRVVFYFSCGGALAGAVMSLVLGDGLHSHTVYGAGLLLAVGTLASLAQLCITRAYAIGRPLVNACLHYLGIVFAYMLGVLFFHDPVTLSATLGMLLIIGAGVTATWLRGRLAPAPKDSQFNPSES